MAIQIQNGTYLDILINENPLPDGHNVFRSLELHSGFGYTVPVAKLELLDMHDMFSGGPMNLVDGTKIQVIISKNIETNDPVEYNMIVFGKVKSTPIPQGYQRSVTLVPDLPSFLIEAQRDYHEGTSVTAITDIAEQHGIEVDAEGVVSNDNMNWINIGKTHSAYIRDILKRTYTGEQTCVTGSLEWNQTYRIRDLFVELQKEAELLCFNLQPVTEIDQTVNFFEVEPDSSSGLFNVLTNYGHKHVQHNLSGTDSVYDAANPLVMGEGLALNSDIHNSVEMTTLTNGRYFDSGQKPLGGGNMHEHYYESEYLNLRHLSLFTESVRGITDSFNDIPLYTVVEYDHVEARGTDTVLNSAYSGKYLVGNKTIVIRESHYAEVYELHRCFINEPGTTPLVASSNSSTVSAKVNPSVATSVDPSDPQRTELAASTQNPNVTSGPSVEQSESKALAVQLGEASSDTFEEETTSPVDQFVADANQSVNDLFDKFKQESSELADSSIISKYGQAYDQLEAVGREFQSALKKLDEYCSELLPSELAALSIVTPDIGSILGTIVTRVNDITKLQSELQADAQSLIDNGNIPSSFINQPKASTNCQTLKEDLIDPVNESTSAISNSCLDKFTMQKMFGPTKDLTKKLREYESLINDLLCANGDTEAGATLTGPGESIVTG